MSNLALILNAWNSKLHTKFKLLCKPAYKEISCTQNQSKLKLNMHISFGMMSLTTVASAVLAFSTRTFL